MIQNMLDLGKIMYMMEKEFFIHIKTNASLKGYGNKMKK